MPLDTDVCIIGSGPGGYVCAIRASQLGLRVALVEEGPLGGVCTNTGCIPTKALLRSAEVYRLARNAKSFGVDVGEVKADFQGMMKRKDRISASLSRGVGALLKAAGVQVVEGRARLAGAGAVEVAKKGGGADLITCRNVVIATGSSAAVPPVPGFDLEGVITSDGALELGEPPKSLVVVGGGAVGVEWISLFAALGSQVSVVEMLERIVPFEDEEISSILRAEFLKQGVGVKTSTRVTGIAGKPGAMKVSVEGADGRGQSLDCALVLNATGRRPNVRELGLETVGLKPAKQGIAVDARMRTDVGGVYAVGDVTGIKLLAHVASHQGVVAAENIAGHDSEMNYGSVPAATFCTPEIASVGMTEAQARERYGEPVVGRFPYMASGRARAYGETEGLVKVVAGPKHREVLGVHAIGAGASDIIGEGVLAIRLEATLDDLREAIHPHPTFTELIGEAAWEAEGAPLNTLPSR